MVLLRLVTVDGCPGTGCPTCALAEDTLRTVLAVCGVPLPAHADGPGEAYLADGRTVEVDHLTCTDDAVPGLDPAHAPYLLVDDEVVLRDAGRDVDRLAEAVVAALYPGGLADLRP